MLPISLQSTLPVSSRIETGRGSGLGLALLPLLVLPAFVALAAIAPPQVIEASAIAAIFLIGVPHGGLDAALAWKLGLLSTPARSAAALSAYLAMVGLVVISWNVFPVATFFAFLVLSAHHFGQDRGWERAASPMTRLALGALPIALPALFFGNEYAQLIGPLVGEWSIFCTQITAVAGALALGWSAIMIIARRNLKEVGPLIALLVLSAALLPPLASFAFYFVVLHSSQHYRRHFARHGNASVQTWAVAGACAALAASAFFGLLAWTEMFAHAPVAALVFVLSGLTLPHAVLTRFANATASRA